MDILDKLSEEFSTEEQKLFVNNFRSYLTYDQEKDYVIDFETVTKFIGFTRKNDAKRVLLKHFNQNEDYTIITDGLLQVEQHEFLLRQPPQQKDPRGGHNKETIMLTPNGFKDFCMKANTEQAHRIRKYYIKMETILFKHINEKLEHTNKELKIANDKVKRLEVEFSKIGKRPKKHYELGDNVYIIKDFTKINVYKVGSTENLNTRIHNYNCHISGDDNSRIVYTKECKNRLVLEKAVHHKFKDFTYNSRHDWFEGIDFETLRTAIDDIQLMLDGELSKFTIDDDFKSNTNIIKEQIEPIQQPQKELFVFNNPNNFDKFIDECCIISTEETITPWIEINSKYRLWARATDNKFKEELAAYLTSKGFERTTVYDPETKTNFMGYNKITIAPPEPIRISDYPTDIELFIYENFKASNTGRVSKNDIYNTYFEWMFYRDSTFEKISFKDRKHLTAYFNAHFFGSIIHDGNRRRYGYYGVTLTGDKEKIGLRINLGNRKPVEQIDPETKEVIRTFASLTTASHHTGIQIPKLSSCISNNKLCNGYFYRKKDITNEKPSKSLS